MKKNNIIPVVIGAALVLYAIYQVYNILIVPYFNGKSDAEFDNPKK